MNSQIINLEDGVIVRLLPNIDKNGIIGNPCRNVSHVWNNDAKYMFTDDIDFPIVDDLYSIMWEFRRDGKDFPFNLTTKYYMYCMDYNFDVKILRFGKSLLDIIEAKINEPFSGQILNPEYGMALKIKRSVESHGFPTFEGTEFIKIDPLSIGKDSATVNSYMMNNREITIESLINKSSWYRGVNRRDIIKTLRELDSEKFDYLKKFSRDDVINDLLGESG